MSGASGHVGGNFATREVVYLAIYEDENLSIQIEYLPLENGCIEITGVHVEPRRVNTIFEERQQARRRHKPQPVQRQLWNDPRDEN